jgi:hypothetical protein
MAKSIFLSTEIARARGLLAGGASIEDLLFLFRRWRTEKPVRGKRKTPQAIALRADTIIEVLQESLAFGAPSEQLLARLQPMIRLEERHWTKLGIIERQYAFQGALAVVVPWAVAALVGELDPNPAMLLGAAFQIMGLGAFTIAVRRALMPSASDYKEGVWIFELLLATWMRVLSGTSLHEGLLRSLEQSKDGEVAQTWRSWISSYTAKGVTVAVGADSSFRWPRHLESSAEAVRFLEPLLVRGAAASEALGTLLNQMDDERQFNLEERLSGLSVRLSLIFTVSFTPAVFAILVGALWPMIKDLPI